MPDLRSRTCCFAGSAALPYRDHQMRDRIRMLVTELVSGGVVFFGLGGETAFDSLVLHVLLELRDTEKLPIRVISVLLFPEDLSSKPEAYRLSREEILERSDKVVYAGRKFYPGIRQERNRKLVDGSACCICCCTGPGGDAADTVRYALKRGLRVLDAGSRNSGSTGKP